MPDCAVIAAFLPRLNVAAALAYLTVRRERQLAALIHPCNLLMGIRRETDKIPWMSISVSIKAQIKFMPAMQYDAVFG